MYNSKVFRAAWVCLAYGGSGKQAKRLMTRCQYPARKAKKLVLAMQEGLRIQELTYSFLQQLKCKG